MVALPFPVSSAPGVRPQEGAGQLINCYAEKTEPGSRFPVVWRRTPGLRQEHDVSAHSHFRGGILIANTTLVAVFDTRAYAVALSGVTFSSTNLGALSGTDRITVAKNNAATPNIVCVTSAGCFNLFTGSAPSAFADADLPQPNSVSELNGYFVFTIGDGRIFASGLNAVTVSTSAFTTEQSTGGLLRGVTLSGEFFAFGRTGTGVYRDIGASPFPFERLPFTIPKGIAGTHAVAGWEDGLKDVLIWVGDDGIVYKLNGYKPEPISNEDVGRVVTAAVLAGEGSNLEASIYTTGKHAFWVLTNPGQWTWEYNITTGNWNERQSDARDDWRMSGTVWAFNRWIAGDRTTGKLSRIDSTYYKELGDPLIFELISGHAASFPSRLQIPRMDFDFTPGTGVAAGEDTIQTDPKAQISWTDDGGHRWSNPVLRRLGGEGESRQRVTVLRGGLTGPQGRRVRIRVSDPVHCGFMGAQMAVEQRSE